MCVHNVYIISDFRMRHAEVTKLEPIPDIAGLTALQVSRIVRTRMRPSAVHSDRFWGEETVTNGTRSLRIGGRCIRRFPRTHTVTCNTCIQRSQHPDEKIQRRIISVAHANTVLLINVGLRIPFSNIKYKLMRTCYFPAACGRHVGSLKQDTAQL